MKFLKKIAKSLFGSSRSSTPKRSKKTKAKPVRKTAAKAVKKKPAPKPAKKKNFHSKSKPAKKAKKKTKRQPLLVKEALSLIPVGEVTHYFPHVQAAVVKITQGEVRHGEILSFRGHTTKFKQAADSMQIDHQPIRLAKEGDELGIQVKSRVRAGDKVYKV